MCKNNNCGATNKKVRSYQFYGMIQPNYTLIVLYIYIYIYTYIYIYIIENTFHCKNTTLLLTYKSYNENGYTYIYRQTRAFTPDRVKL